ncbi:MAG: glycosyltransferase family 2 protein [Clostridia bacterium]|nr:glycosyltransferase family 2 protein [Clostridia bacterium]
MPLQEDYLISVIMPIYNAGSFLRKGVESVLVQTHRNLEMILVDDGSTDGSGEICDAFAEKDDRVRVIHQANGGVSRARNVGLTAAKGDYIAWLDSDDYFLPTVLERLLTAMLRHGKQIAMCNYINLKTDGSSKPRYELPYDEKAYSREDMVGMILGIGFTPVLWANLMERKLYEGIRFPEGRLFEDVSTTYRLHERAEGAVFVADPLLMRRQRRDSISVIPTLSNRIDGCRAYIARYEDAVQRWPQYGQAMLVSSARTLLLLRKNALHNSICRVHSARKELAEVCGFYRRHSPEILPENASRCFRLEFRLITSGTYVDFLLSKVLDEIVLKPQSYLKDLKTPGLPPY